MSSVILTILAWPEAMPQPGRLEALAAAFGVEPPDGRLLLRRATPMPMPPLAREHALQAAGMLQAAGVPVAAISLEAIKRLEEPLRLRELTPKPGPSGHTLVCTPWKGEPVETPAAGVALLARALVRRSKTVTSGGHDDPALTIGLDMAGLPGTGIAGAIRDSALSRQTSTAHSSTHVLDIFAGSKRLRVDGAKFNFRSTGIGKAYSDHASARALLDLLRSLCPGAALDEQFGSFSPPGPLQLSRFLGAVGSIGPSEFLTTIRDDTGAFGFYGAWKYLLLRALARPPSAEGAR